MVSEKVNGFIGKVGEARIYEVEKGAIRKYADAVGETNPLYWDEDYAKQAGYDSLVAPPGFFGWPSGWTETMPFFDPLKGGMMQALAEDGYPRILDGGIEYDFFKPIVAGDILKTVTSMLGLKEREGKSGTMFIFTIETSFTNQRGDLVAKLRQNSIAR